jgi:hypothetical protein
MDGPCPFGPLRPKPRARRRHFSVVCRQVLVQPDQTISSVAAHAGPLVTETHGIDLLERAKQPVLDNLPPPE